MSTETEIVVDIFDPHNSVTVRGEQFEWVVERASDVILDSLMRGAGIGVNVRASDLETESRVREALDQVALKVEGGYRLTAHERYALSQIQHPPAELFIDHPARRVGKSFAMELARETFNERLNSLVAEEAKKLPLKISMDEARWNLPLTPSGNRHERRKAKALKGRG